MSLHSDIYRQFLNEKEIEARLIMTPGLENFWQKNNPMLIFRSRPYGQDPVYEVQLVWDLGDRVQTYAWLWIDALEGKIIARFPD